MEKDAVGLLGNKSLWPFVLVGLAGAVAGAAVGVLFAPEPGKESRRKLAQWLKEKREKGRHELQARKEQVEAAIEAGRRAYKGEKDTIGI
ncbi:MAG: YtxH domain-containing protein [Elusimicrobia bacterium]|nr:YtxH domain-containing protein [Elusimicrobiota bacterium]